MAYSNTWNSSISGKKRCRQVTEQDGNEPEEEKDSGDEPQESEDEVASVSTRGARTRGRQRELTALPPGRAVVTRGSLSPTKRRSPRKRPLQDEDESSPRKRGRPRKYPLRKRPAEKPKSLSPRKRGRPGKYPLPGPQVKSPKTRTTPPLQQGRLRLKLSPRLIGLGAALENVRCHLNHKTNHCRERGAALESTHCRSVQPKCPISLRHPESQQVVLGSFQCPSLLLLPLQFWLLLLQRLDRHRNYKSTVTKTLLHRQQGRIEGSSNPKFALIRVMEMVDIGVKRDNRFERFHSMCS